MEVVGWCFFSRVHMRKAKPLVHQSRFLPYRRMRWRHISRNFVWPTLSNTGIVESAKSRACILCVFTCLVCLHVCTLTCLACLRAYVVGVLMGLGMLTRSVCLRVYVCACYDEMFYFYTCLRTWCAFLSYLLYISIFKFKNSHSKRNVCFVKLNIFLSYILIPTKAIWICYNLYIHLLH